MSAEIRRLLAVEAALIALLPDVEHEIEQRKWSGNDEYWAELERKALTARAALAGGEHEPRADGEVKS